MWCLAIQLFGFGVVMPLWCLIHILSSPPPPLNRAQLLARSSSLANLHLAIILGYIIPTILMCLAFSNTTHQNLIAAWQLFPIWISVSYHTLQYLSPPPTSSISQSHGHVSRGKNTILTAYSFIAPIVAVTHLIPIIFVVAACWPASLERCASTDPTHLTFSKIYLPPNPIMPEEVSSIARGIHVFLQWDCYVGVVALWLWSYPMKARLGSVRLTDMVMAAFWGPGALVLKGMS